ncbi:hypothetical protein B425_4091 [Bacillus amyloliquefaciens]|nr:hypothetical protein B425_4091 [Bacillus amyloliquefaciens]
MSIEEFILFVFIAVIVSLLFLDTRKRIKKRADIMSTHIQRVMRF